MTCSCARRRSSTRPRRATTTCIDVGIKCARIGNSSMLFIGAVFRQDEVLVARRARLRLRRSRRTAARCRFRRRYAPLLEGFEDGQPMLDVRVGAWRELETAARPIRAEVFIDEQQIPAEMEWDDADAARGPCRRIQPARPCPRHRPDARARARCRQDRPDGRRGGLAPRRRRSRRARRATCRGSRARRP